MRAIDFPFTLNPFGRANTTTTESKIYLDRLLTLLSTQVGQRPMLPEYGTNMAKALFENEEDFYPAARTAITDAVSLWLPELRIDKLEIEDIDEQGFANIKVIVELPDAKITSVTINTAIFGANGLIERAGA
jgi:phage baseplate assembly protein W